MAVKVARKALFVCFALTAMALYLSREFLSDYSSPSKFLAASTSFCPAAEQDGNGKAGETEREGAKDNPMFLPEYVERRDVANKVCMKLNQRGLADQNYKLMRYSMTAYCVIPKVACTFWISVFRFLNNDTMGRSSPLDMTKYAVHFSRWNMIHTYKRFAEGAHDFRFMFVREPYSRLWSAYVDKLLLPDLWKSEGLHIVKKMRGEGKVDECANDITFKEFIEYLVISDTSQLDVHWRPMFHLCNPCIYRPHLIGKLETFSQDARHVLRHMNASWVLGSPRNQSRLEGEVNQQIDYNLNMSTWREHVAVCSNLSDLAQRQWTAFQINGYIPVEIPFPRQRLDGKLKMDGKELKTVVHEVLASHGWSKSREERRAQREQTMLQGYSTVPIATLHRLKDMYRYDFEMFGYDPEPPAIFHRSQ